MNNYTIIETVAETLEKMINCEEELLKYSLESSVFLTRTVVDIQKQSLDIYFKMIRTPIENMTISK